MQDDSGRGAVNDGSMLLPWLVIRQDDNGNRYRVGRYATKDEAEKTAADLDERGNERVYSVERVAQTTP
jgi:hypothetical protein